MKPTASAATESPLPAAPPKTNAPGIPRNTGRVGSKTAYSPTFWEVR
jgi:hypothetical protein